MTAQALQTPLPIFTGLDGRPLTGGYVYFGNVSQDSRQYPVAVYWDEALTLPATQPLRTSAGYIVRNGCPAPVYINGDCSVLVLDLLERQVYYVPDWDGIAGAAAAAAAPYATAAAASATTAAAKAVEASNYAALAATGAKFYDTIALGRAGVADTQTFGVKAGGTDALLRPTVYRRDSAGTQTLLFAVLSASEFETDVTAAADIIISPTFAGLPAGQAVGKFALVVADRLPVTSTTRARTNGVPFLVFNAAHGLAVGASVNIRGFGGVGYNGHFTLRTATSTFIDYKGASAFAGESTTADTGGYIDRNGVYQYDGTQWSWVADIGAAYPTRPAHRAANRASVALKAATPRDAFEQYFTPAFQPLQRVMTINEVGTLSVDSIIPNSPDTLPQIFANATLLPAPTKNGNNYTTAYTAPGAVDLNIDLKAVVDTRQGTAKLAVAEAVRFSQDLTTWTRTNITSVTGGQADPDGGNNAYRVLCAANGSAVAHTISVTAAPASTGPLVGFPVWVKADTASIVAVTSGSGTAWVNTATNEIQTQNVNCALVERRGSWFGLWWQQRVTGTPASTFSLGIVSAMGSTTNTTAGTEALVLYKPRQVDGVLPFFNRQRAAWRNGSVGYATRYVARSDFMDSAASMNTDINVDVVLPDSYTPTKRYPVLYVLEVEAIPGNTAQDGLQTLKGLGVHNTYDCILVRTYHPTGDIPWYCTKNDGTKQHDVFLRDCVVDYIDRHYSTIRSREGRLLIGFSKSGFGATSLLLRNPTVFGYVAAWDVPWGLQYDGTDNYILDAFGNPSVNDYGQSGAFGSLAQYQTYNPADILAANLASVNDKTRMVIGGAVVFYGDLPYFRGLLDANGVPYALHETSTWIAAGGTDHNWSPPTAACAWLPQMVAMLFALR